MSRAWLSLLVLGTSLAATQARAAESGETEVEAPTADPIGRARAREALLQTRTAEAEARARAEALAAYRLAQRRRADFFPHADRRLSDSRALDGALRVLARGAGEATTLRRELATAAHERARLEAGARGDEPLSAESGESRLPRPADATLRLGWPTARATVLGGPGLARDAASSIEFRRNGLELLGRMNAPVLAPAAGKIRKAEALPEGGFALVIEHDDGLVSILTGLRQLEVGPGARVARDQPLGLLGRNLDGAPVLGFELWRDRAPIDPRPLLDRP